MSFKRFCVTVEVQALKKILDTLFFYSRIDTADSSSAVSLTLRSNSYFYHDLW